MSSFKNLMSVDFAARSIWKEINILKRFNASDVISKRLNLVYQELKVTGRWRSAQKYRELILVFKTLLTLSSWKYVERWRWNVEPLKQFSLW